MITPTIAVNEFQDFSPFIRKKSRSRVPRPKQARTVSGKMKTKSRRVARKRLAREPEAST